MVYKLASSWVMRSKGCFQVQVVAALLGLALGIIDHPAGALWQSSAAVWTPCWQPDLAGSLQQVAAYSLAQIRLAQEFLSPIACGPQSYVVHPRSCYMSSGWMTHFAPVGVQVAIAVALTFVFLSMAFPPAIVIPALLKLCSQGEQPDEVATKAGYKALPDADAEGGIASSHASSGMGDSLQCMENQ